MKAPAPATWIGAALALAGPGLAAASPPAASRSLPPAPLEVVLAGGENHVWHVDLAGGDYLNVVVDQRGIDVVTEGVAPDGGVLVEVNSPSERVGREPLTLIAATAGEYRIVVRPSSAEAPPGRYEIAIDALRPATGEDHRRHAAERAQLTAYRAGEGRGSDGYRESVHRYRKVLAEWQALGERSREAEVLFRLGSYLRLLGEHREAAAAQRQALEIFRQLGDRRGQAQAWNQLGLIAWAENEPEAAREHYRQALDLLILLGDLPHQARTWNNLGLVGTRTGRLDEALAGFRQALEIFEQTGDSKRQAIGLINVAGVLNLRGDPAGALANHRQALELARSLADRRLEAQALHNQGVLYMRLGRARDAVERFTAALPLFREQGDRRRQAAALAALGTLHLWLRDFDRALAEIGEALELETAIGNRRGQAKNLNGLAVLYVATDSTARALPLHRRALEIHREIGDRRQEAATLQLLGRALVTAGDPSAGLAALTESVALNQALGLPMAETRALLGRGEAHFALGDADSALADFRGALARSRGAGARLLKIDSLRQMAVVERDRGELTAALATAERALELAESQRTAIAGNDLRTSYFASLSSVYELSIDVLVDLASGAGDGGRDLVGQAFEIAERARARGFLDQLREVRLELRQGVVPELAAREKRLLLELDDKVQRQRRQREKGAAKAGIAALEADIDRQLRELADLRAEIRAVSPAYASLNQPVEVELAQVQERDLDADTVLLEYLLGSRRSFLWCVTPTTATVHGLAPQEQIEALVREVFADLSDADPRRGAGERRALEQLSQLLLGPVVAELGDKRLAIVADGALQYLPFAALPVAGEPLVARHELVYLPSAAVLAELRRPRAEGREPARMLALFADPVFSADDPRVAHSPPAAAASVAPARASFDNVPGRSLERLAWSRREAEGIADTLVGRWPREELFLATDFASSVEAVTSGLLRDYRILHFATHGLVDSGRPQLSALVLSLVDAGGRPQDGFLRLYDVYDLDLAADLVVLSGCRTALGREIRGEGLQGLSRGFFHAGASRVMASLWSVQDRATGELMARFYRALFEQRLTPAAALRQAQVSMWRDAQWAAPFHWAGFVIQGDWR